MLVLRRKEGQWTEIVHRSGDVVWFRVYDIQPGKMGKLQIAFLDDARNFKINRPERPSARDEQLPGPPRHVFPQNLPQDDSMLKEITTIDIVCRVVGILAQQSEPISAGEVAALMGGSASYVPKVLSRMAHCGLVRSGVGGYELADRLPQLTVADALKVCHTPLMAGPAARIADRLMESARAIPLRDVL